MVVATPAAKAMWAKKRTKSSAGAVGEAEDPAAGAAKAVVRSSPQCGQEYAKADECQQKIGGIEHGFDAAHREIGSLGQLPGRDALGNEGGGEGIYTIGDDRCGEGVDGTAGEDRHGSRQIEGGG